MSNRGYGDLSRATVHEADDSWPTHLEIVAYWGKDKDSRRGKRRSVEINSDEFFGRNGYGAPMSAEQLFRIIDRLRRAK